MQFKNIALSLFVAAVAAESVDELVKQIPSCATTCLNDGAKKVGCAVDDYKCQCGKITDITSDAIPCVSAACSSDDLVSKYPICFLRGVMMQTYARRQTRGLGMLT
ncbi:hypothetical protein RRF57_004613 [Xylaria bambusicola]|uniref:CFEM domain-containing protein n=1 Tax=Xylaria bambusicola TaxID=326684 RepID=A0AAN7Z6N6_9PEZI